MSDATRSQIRGSTLLLGGQAFAVVVNLTTQVLLVRTLSKGSYGAFAFALSIVALAEAFAAFGLRRGVSRFVPAYEERGEPAKAAGTLVFAVVTVLSLGLAVVLVVIGLRGVIAGGVDGGESAKALLAILILLAPLQALENLLDGAFAVFARPRAIAARKHVLSPTLRLVVVALVALSDGESTAIAAGYVGAGVLGLAVYGAMLRRVLRGRGLLSARPLQFPAREVLGFTVPLLSTDVAAALLNSAATVLLGALATAAAVAEFRAVLPISLTMTYVLSSFGLLFVPLASRLLEHGRHEEADRLYWRTAAWSAVFSFPVFALAFAFGEQLATLLFGDRYAGSGDVLAALVVGHFVTAAVGPNGVLLAVYGEVRYIVVTNLVAVAVNLALSAALIAAYGALGAAIAASVTQVVLNLGRQVGLARRTEVRGFDPAFGPLYAVMGALAAVLLVIALAGDPPLASGFLFVAGAWLVVLDLARRRLDLLGTFPELAKVPGLARVLGS